MHIMVSLDNWQLMFANAWRFSFPFQLVHKLGRNMRDFFLNLDNLHDYLKFTFPRMKAPSFFVEAETENCKTRQGLHYTV